MAQREPVTVGYSKINSETAKAVQFDIDGDVVWLPIGQITLDRNSKQVTIPHWLYKDKFPNDPQSR